MKEGEKPKADLKMEDMPENPTPWLESGPRDLSFHVIPTKPRIFSPVIVCPAFWNSADIIFPDSISWNFGIPGSNTKKIATGTFFILPGKKKIIMTVTDSTGRKASVTREIDVTW